MNEKDIIRAAMRTCGWNQEELAKKAGYISRSGISNRLNGKSMRVDTFVKMLAAMGYEVVVRGKDTLANSNKWIVSCDDTLPATIENKPDTLGKIDLDKLLASEEEDPVQTPEGRIKLR